MDYVILSMTLLAVGIYGLVTKRNLLKVLISIEIIAAAASMNFVAFASMVGGSLGQAFLILALSVDTTLTAIIIALVVVAYRDLGTIDIWALSRLREVRAARRRGKRR
ncbi:MAG: NAD(P)H-quinone oxidoreductase subunit 4L [Candidatus Bathyarchaeota archaeon B26-2]|nr:MAG: NAD(P)H-quinone oxidoreductase subunit 4L [Candidatus Bathyarchaeota archaeon B26-2]